MVEPSEEKNLKFLTDLHIHCILNKMQTVSKILEKKIGYVIILFEK